MIFLIHLILLLLILLLALIIMKEGRSVRLFEANAQSYLEDF